MSEKIEIKCPCGLREHMEADDCNKADCDKCCPIAKGDNDD